ncbi:hypothetical protein COO60DRAFT_1569957, partial [Scenedesmus sp. NREL 46B-D3]
MPSDLCRVALQSCAAFCQWLIRQSGVLYLLMFRAVLEAVGWCRGVLLLFLSSLWDARNACTHSGAVLPPLSAPVGRGADGA